MRLPHAALLLVFAGCSPSSPRPSEFPEHLRYRVDPAGLDVELLLTRQDDLLAQGLRAAALQSDGSTLVDEQPLPHCHYRTQPGSTWAAFSNCSGPDAIEGTLVVDGVTYLVSPSTAGRVKLTSPVDEERDVELRPIALPVDERALPPTARVESARVGSSTQALGPNHKVIQLFVFNDQAEWQMHHDLVIPRAAQIANTMNGTLANLTAGAMTFEIVLSGIVSFPQGDPYPVPANLDMQATLTAFSTWKTSARTRLEAAFGAQMDVALLVSQLPLVNAGSPSSVGLAFLASVCTADCAELVLDRMNPGATGATAVHELGHILGAQHDLNSNAFVMAPATGPMPGTMWSSASAAAIAQTVSPRMCLDNNGPALSDGAHCGNGIIEAGEACDSVDADPCCVFCQLAADAECSPSQGACCTNACTIIRDATTICAPGAGACQPAAQCNGITAVCFAPPAPVGTACTTADLALAGICFHGTCVSRTEECRQVNNAQYPMSTGCVSTTTCNQLACDLNGGNACTANWLIPAIDGLPCGGAASPASRVCVAGTCTLASSISVDDCPVDAAKTQPGLCGCNRADTDSDNDGTPDCADRCPTTAGLIAPPCTPPMPDAGMMAASSSGAGSSSSSASSVLSSSSEILVSSSGLTPSSSEILVSSSSQGSSSEVGASSSDMVFPSSTTGASSDSATSSSSFGAASSSSSASSLATSSAPVSSSAHAESSSAAVIFSSSAVHAASSSRGEGSSLARSSSSIPVTESSSAGAAAATSADETGDRDPQPACACVTTENRAGGAWVLLVLVGALRRRGTAARIHAHTTGARR